MRSCRTFPGQRCAQSSSISGSLSEELIEALCARQWPGNIRQLRNALRAMIALRASDKLDLADLPSDFRLGTRTAEPRPAPGERLSQGLALNALARAEREALLRELELERSNLSHVARKLGVSRNALYRKMHRLGIQRPLKKPLH